MLTNRNGHQAIEPTTSIERRLADHAATTEQRILTLRDALADFVSTELSQRDDEIIALKKHIIILETKLEQQGSAAQLVHEIETRLEEKAARRDAAKRGPRGPKGDQGRRGETGARGAQGPPGKDAQPSKVHWHIDATRYVVTPFVDGFSLGELDLRPLFVQFQNETS
jgi:hypothetical protein